jgi:glycosyltransferase involved in cell wall biosynthesis
MIWIAWEKHRRTIELSKALGATLFIFDFDTMYIFRLIKSSLKTFITISKHRPNVLIVQNPSMILATLACILKNIFKYKLVIDRHSNFRLDNKNSFSMRIFHRLSNYTLENADITIVTNDDAKKIVEEKKGRCIILPDKIPHLSKKADLSLKGKFNIVNISSFSRDEPYEEVIRAASLLGDNIIIYITGNFNKIDSEIRENLPKNVIFTGFIKEEEFIDLLFNSDIIMDFTTAELTLVCGGYEAMATEKPFITSYTNTLKKYYKNYVYYTNNRASDIASSVLYIRANLEQSKKNMIMLKKEKIEEWEFQFQCLKNLL